MTAYEQVRQLIYEGAYRPDVDYTKVDRREWRELLQQARNEFKKDLELAYNVQGHPKADMLFQKAWENGHHAGFSEVLIHYDNLVELIK